MTGAHTPSVADVLDAAADLLTPEGAWTQHAYAKNAAGHDVNPRERWQESPGAVCFCLYGALAETASKVGVRKSSALTNGLPGTDWNDAPGRTQSEVIAKLREAANAARATSKEASHG